jgi:hypothetical protein
MIILLLLVSLLAGCGASTPEPLDPLIAAGREAFAEYGGELPPVLVTWRRDSGPLAECRRAGSTLVVEVHAGRIALFSQNADEQAALFKAALLAELKNVATGCLSGGRP